MFFTKILIFTDLLRNTHLNQYVLLFKKTNRKFTIPLSNSNMLIPLLFSSRKKWTL